MKQIKQKQKYCKGTKESIIDLCAFEKFGVLIRKQQSNTGSEQYNALEM